MGAFPPQALLGLSSRLKRPWVEREERRRHLEALRVATERLVDQITPELRSQSDYRARLAPVVERIREHSITVVDSIPGPIPIDKERWTSDTLVNVLFPDPSALRAAVSGPLVQKWLQDNPEDPAFELYGLLLAKPKERSQIGSEMRGDRLERDVKQKTLRFTEHEIVAVDSDPDRLRLALARPVADLIQSLGIGRLTTQEERIVALEETLRVLRLKLKVITPRVEGVDLLLGTRAENVAELQRLQAKITESERALVMARRGLNGIEQYFERISELLAYPEEAVQLEPMCLWLDRMNVIRDSSHPRAREVALMRATNRGKPGRIVLFVRFPRALIAVGNGGTDPAEAPPDDG
jgi:hypothetical protein